MTLQTLLQTEKSIRELSSWGFAFETTDGRREYRTPIYRLFLDAFAKAQITGSVLLFATDVYGVSDHPVYLVQLVPVSKKSDTDLLGSGFEGFEKFRDLISELAATDTSMRFFSEFSEIGDATDPLGNSILRGCIELKSGAITFLKQTDPEEKSLFELVCKERYPGLAEALLPQEEAADSHRESTPETCFNLFVYVHDQHVVALGANVHEVEGDEATCLAFLQSMVPKDALTSTRYTFSPSQATETLSCGTLGLPMTHYETMKMRGQVVNLFEPIFQRYNAPQAPLMCVTTVENGVPVNSAGPIYQDGSPEIDQILRHNVFLSRLLSNSVGLIHSTVQQEGRAVFLLLPDPKTLDHENRKLIYLKQEDCTEPGSAWDNIRLALSVYDPQSEVLFFFKDATGGYAYRLKLTSMEERMQQPS